MWLCPKCGTWNTGYVTTTGCMCCGYEKVAYGTGTDNQPPPITGEEAKQFHRQLNTDPPKQVKEFYKDTKKLVKKLGIIPQERDDDRKTQN